MKSGNKPPEVQAVNEMLRCDKNTEMMIVSAFAPDISSPKVTSWAAPAKKIADMPTLCQKSRPD